MSGWGKTHAIRTEAGAMEIRTALEAVNDKLLHMPPRFKVTVNADGRSLALIEDTEKKETD